MDHFKQLQYLVLQIQRELTEANPTRASLSADGRLIKISRHFRTSTFSGIQVLLIPKRYSGAPRRGRPLFFADLWRGQADALRQWHTKLREASDVLMTLNTGAGKTVVGALIAQSLVNEGLEHVVYACGTIDLVRQTEREALRLGLSPTLRIQQQLSDDRFEVGKSFCITTYMSLYNPFSRFRTSLRPSAIIFDDAHTSEGYLRDAFTITIDRQKNEDIFLDITRILAPSFRQIGRLETFNDVMNHGPSREILLVPPFSVHESADALATVLRKLRSDQARKEEFAFRWGSLADHVQHCAVTVSNRTVEFTPPFLPITTLPYFTDEVRRVYLSATINYKSDLVRCCGREIPDPNIIAPKNDAGEGERLVMFSRYLENGDALETAIAEMARGAKARRLCALLSSCKTVGRTLALLPGLRISPQRWTISVTVRLAPFSLYIGWTELTSPTRCVASW